MPQIISIDDALLFAWIYRTIDPSWTIYRAMYKFGAGTMTLYPSASPTTSPTDTTSSPTTPEPANSSIITQTDRLQCV